MWDSIWLNAHLATLRQGKYGIIERGALAAAEGRIAWAGAACTPGANPCAGVVQRGQALSAAEFH